MRHCAFYMALFLICNQGVSQNIWMENTTIQVSCFIKDSVSFHIYDPDGLVTITSDTLFYGDGTWDMIGLVGLPTFDTAILHDYPGCGRYSRWFKSTAFSPIGLNVSSSANDYYAEQIVAFGTNEPYSRSPELDLHYELTRCQNEPFLFNVLQRERNGDSLSFSLETFQGTIIIPEGVSINDRTGEISWTGTPDTGLYQFILKIDEYFWYQPKWRAATHYPRFTVRVVDSCQTFIAHDDLGTENLFEQAGREFQLITDETWEYGFQVSKQGWDSVTVKPSSELLQDGIWSTHTITDLGDSVRMDMEWTTSEVSKRNHPYLVTYHVTGYKNGDAHHRILTNALHVDFPLGIEAEVQEPLPFVYPNPVTDILTVTASGGWVDYLLFDLTGHKLASGTVTGEIDMSRFEAGVYLLHLSGDQSQTVRVVKY